MRSIHRWALAMGLAALAGCQEQPCPPDQALCGPGEQGALTLTHGGLVVTAGHGVDDTHSSHGRLTLGHVQSETDGLRLTASLAQ